MKQITGGIQLVRFVEGKKSKRFELDAKEIDALIAARQAFLADITARELATKARIADEIEEAQRLVEMVCKDNDLSWRLCEHPAMGSQYILRNESTGVTLIHSMRENYVLESVKLYLVRQKLIADAPKPVSDDFDPFLDEADLP
jgi:hypothetical protein